MSRSVSKRGVAAAWAAEEDAEAATTGRRRDVHFGQPALPHPTKSLAVPPPRRRDGSGDYRLAALDAPPPSNSIRVAGERGCRRRSFAFFLASSIRVRRTVFGNGYLGEQNSAKSLRVWCL